MLKAMLRAKRAARNVTNGAEVIDFLTNARTRKLLVAAAAEGEPPVAAVSQALIELLGSKELKSTPVKQFIGLAVRAVLEEEGFEVAKTGVWLGDDPVFTTGATYQKIAKAGRAKGENEDSLLERFVASLSDEELNRVSDLVRRRQKSKK